MGGRPVKQVYEGQRILEEGDDAVVTERVLRGMYVPAREIHRINGERARKGQAFLATPFGRYEDDKKRLATLRLEAREDIKQWCRMYAENISQFTAADDEDRAKICDVFNSSGSIPKKDEERIWNELGDWFGSYLKEIDDDEEKDVQGMGLNLTTDNFELSMLRHQRLMMKYDDLIDEGDLLSYENLTDPAPIRSRSSLLISSRSRSRLLVHM